MALNRVERMLLELLDLGSTLMCAPSLNTIQDSGSFESITSKRMVQALC